MFSYRYVFEVSLIVFIIKVRVGGQLGLRDRIIVALGIDSCAVFHATFPLPQIIGCSKLTITDKVCTAGSFHIEVTGTYIEYNILGQSGYGNITILIAVSSLTQCIDITESCSRTTAFATANH